MVGEGSKPIVRNIKNPYKSDFGFQDAYLLYEKFTRNGKTVLPCYTRFTFTTTPLSLQIAKCCILPYIYAFLKLLK